MNDDDSGDDGDDGDDGDEGDDGNDGDGANGGDTSDDDAYAQHKNDEHADILSPNVSWHLS